MATKKRPVNIDVSSLVDFSKRIKEEQEYNIPKLWSKKELVELILLLSKKNDGR